MTITDLREIAAASGIQHAELCLEQHTTQIGRDAADPRWLEMSKACGGIRRRARWTNGPSVSSRRGGLTDERRAIHAG
jgi:hypothetical protein